MVAYLLVLGSDRGQEEQRQQALLQGLALPLKSKEDGDYDDDDDGSLSGSIKSAIN